MPLSGVARRPHSSQNGMPMSVLACVVIHLLDRVGLTTAERPACLDGGDKGDWAQLKMRLRRRADTAVLGANAASPHARL
jgi:hypothetical protein